MKTMVLVLLVILGLFCCSHVSQAVRCYECNTVYSGECQDPVESTHTCYGDYGPDAACYKIRKPISCQFMHDYFLFYRNLCNKSEQINIPHSLNRKCKKTLQLKFKTNVKTFQTRCRAIAGRTARCRCFRYLSNFTKSR